MKKLILLFITLTTFMNLSFASFPVTENNTLEVSTKVNFQDPDDEEDDTSLLEYILLGILVFGALGFSLYFTIRAWMRAWRNNVSWVRKLTKVLMWIAIAFLSLVLLVVITGFSGGGSGMGG